MASTSHGEAIKLRMIALELELTHFAFAGTYSPLMPRRLEKRKLIRVAINVSARRSSSSHDAPRKLECGGFLGERDSILTLGKPRVLASTHTWTTYLIDQPSAKNALVSLSSQILPVSAVTKSLKSMRQSTKLNKKGLNLGNPFERISYRSPLRQKYRRPL